MRVIADSNIPLIEALLPASAELLRLPGRAIDRGAVESADALLVRSVTPVTRELVTGTALRFVGTATAGIDHIDREALDELGVAFAHAPGSNAASVAEYVLAAIMATDDYWDRISRRGGAVGIVGFGAVGRSLGTRLHGLGIDFRAYDPWLDPSQHACLVNTLEEVLACEVVTLHCALTDAEPWPSRNLLNATTLKQLNPDALLVNASRGSVIDEAALLGLLETRPRLRLAFDVWAGEPAPDLCLLRRCRLATAHIAGYSLDAKLRGSLAICSALGEALGIATMCRIPGALDAPALELHEVSDTAEAARLLIEGRYRITADDALVRTVLEEANGERSRVSRAFDALRAGYRERREVAGNPVRLCAASPEARQAAAALEATFEATEVS